MPNSKTGREVVVARRHGIFAETRTGPFVATALPLHFHEDLQVILSESRLISYHVRGANIFSPLASVFLIEPELPHSAQVASRQPAWGPLRTLLLPRSAFDRYLGEGAGAELLVPSPICPDPSLLEDLRRTHDLIAGSHDDLACESALAVSLQQLVKRMRRASPPRASRKSETKMRRVRAYLGSDLSRSMTLSEIAQEVQLSPHHLIRQFHVMFGLSPHAFRTQLRVSRARDLLLQKHSIADAAQSTGFSDHAHLTRIFHCIVGVPPSRYRNSNFLQDERQTNRK